MTSLKLIGRVSVARCIVSLLVLTAGAKAEREFCALRVLVESTFRGKPAEEEVRLIDSGGRTVATKRTTKGVAEFCDMPFGKHSILIAPGECLPVIINNVEMVFEDEQEVRAIVNKCRNRDGFRTLDPR